MENWQKVFSYSQLAAQYFTNEDLWLEGETLVQFSEIFRFLTKLMFHPRNAETICLNPMYHRGHLNQKNCSFLSNNSTDKSNRSLNFPK